VEGITAFFVVFMKPETKEYLNQTIRQLGRVSYMASAMVFSTFAGVWFGYWLDKDVFHGKTHPWMTIIFFFFGLAGGIRNLYVLGGRMRKDEERSAGKRNGADSK